MSTAFFDPRVAPVLDVTDLRTLLPLAVFAIVTTLSNEDAWHTAIYHLRTSYLFVRSDIKTIILPVTVFAAVTAPASSSLGVAMAIAWTWLHLITFNFSNQYRSVAEDKLNKPWRPIPAGRICLETADRLRWLGCSACLGLSALGGRALFVSSAAFLVTAIAYDETTLPKHWFGKNVMGTIAYPTASAGATMLMRGDFTLDAATALSVMVLSAVVVTSLHAQDFCDVVGDLAMGRTTLPILYPEASRIVTCATVVAWSVVLPIYWRAGPAAAAALLSAGTFVAWRFWHLRTAAADRRSYVYYNLWLTGSIMLPASVRWVIMLAA